MIDLSKGYSDKDYMDFDLDFDFDKDFVGTDSGFGMDFVGMDFVGRDFADKDFADKGFADKGFVGNFACKDFVDRDFACLEHAVEADMDYNSWVAVVGIVAYSSSF